MSTTKKYPASKPATKTYAGRTAHAGTNNVAAAKSAPARAGKAKGAASYILSAPNGPRTVSHRQIKEAVEKVFRERVEANE